MRILTGLSEEYVKFDQNDLKCMSSTIFIKISSCGKLAVFEQIVVLILQMNELRVVGFD